MPRTPRLCGQPGASKCFNPATVKGRCAEHAPAPFAAAKARWSAGKPSDYDRTRTRVIREAQGRCELCGSPGTQVDHIVPVAEDGTWDRSNLRLLCTTCHDTKSQEDARRGRAHRRRMAR